MIYLTSLLTFVRVIQYSSAHPRTGVLIQTLRRSANNLFHFLIIFLALNFCLALIGTVTFGQTYEQFSDPATSLYTLYIGFLSGDFPDFSKDALFGIYAVTFAFLIW